MRGLSAFEMDFKYPITAIAGTNGSGKSTILAIAACAFHNGSDGFRLPGRVQSYYTFSDFFIQSIGEVGPQGVAIAYSIRHDRWKSGVPREGLQVRKKKQGGKWNNYDKRVKRTVIYHGVQRVVPYYERSAHKSYRTYFKPNDLDVSVREKIASIAGRILGKKYSDFEHLEHSRYSLPRVKSGDLAYSGFNMGAGESAVLEILSTIFSSGSGSLIIIDEIELGLHELAQVRLVKELKELCLEMKCQIICTTHAYEVLAALPPEARIFVEPIGGKTNVLPEISADYACGRMGRSGSEEIDIFVEDEVAMAMVQASMDQSLRGRTRLMEIGSYSSLKRLMAARYMENRRRCLCIMDGDQRSGKVGIAGDVADMCDGKFSTQSEAIREWVAARLSFLPGDEWPEKWLFEKAISLCSQDEGWEQSPADVWGVPNAASLREMFEQCLAAGKHCEFPALAEVLTLPEENVRRELISALRVSLPDDFNKIAEFVAGAMA
ncbi:AAA family ATPase [Sphingopyxis sp. YF1]|uniref:ATP-dependent nuclease n=1 Tax=Sphingopyxis sp. YF1 TaxID=2482763 RepID=UPI002415E922|nr:AAA family ATPase [Sphingopyxis sp. YF1]